MQFTYETHYKSNRPDGRHTSTLAAFVERMRQEKQELALPDELTVESFNEWKGQVREQVRELFRMPDWTEQPAPVKLSTVQREGYRVERWEFYPDDYSVVPYLMLIPDGTSADSPAPAVMCFPGSSHSKEFFAGEPLLDIPNCQFKTYPERNAMGKYMVENGMVAIVFDNPETAEVSMRIDDWNTWRSRNRLTYGLIQQGYSYFSVSLFQKLRFLEHLKTVDFVDQQRIAVCGHSLGCDDAMHMAILCDEVKAVVFNDANCSELHRFYSTTECDSNAINGDTQLWHLVPGHFRYFCRPDLLASLAPKYLALNEGGSDYDLDKVRRTYELCGVPDHLQITHYPKYQDEALRSKIYEPPQYGLSQDTYFDFTNIDAPDHSFRAEPSLRLLKRAFNL